MDNTTAVVDSTNCLKQVLDNKVVVAEGSAGMVCSDKTSGSLVVSRPQASRCNLVVGWCTAAGLEKRSGGGTAEQCC